MDRKCKMAVAALGVVAAMICVGACGAKGISADGAPGTKASVKSTSANRGAKKKSYDVAAYIWPAYHNDPRWSEIGLFPDGKGEWEAVYSARPKFEGHRQPRVPLWGYFDETDPRMQEKIIRTATKYGVNTFIFDWYWFDNRPFLEDVLDKGFLGARNNGKMKFYLMWANHLATAYWDRHESDKSKYYWRGEVTREVFEGFTDHIIRDYFTRDNYYTIDGKPVFAIYEVGTFIRGVGGIDEAREALESLRTKCVKAGLPGVHIQAIMWSALPETPSRVAAVGATGGADGSAAAGSAAGGAVGSAAGSAAGEAAGSAAGDGGVSQENTLRTLGFDSITNYQWCHLVPANMDYQSWGEKGQAFYEKYDREISVPYFPHVSIDWDNNPRYPGPAQPCVTGVTPEKFEGFLRKAKAYADAHPDQPPLVTINAWNEWSEGSCLEPDTYYKYGFLKAVKKVFK